MIAPTHLKSLQALELAIRMGSLKAAADVLSITPAAVGQRIKVLEEFLGFDLVVRGRSGLRPTPSLSRALPSLSNAFLELGSAAAALDLQRVNEIQIAANSDWAELWLAPRLARFRAAWPNTLFCINGEGDFPMRLGRSDVEVSFRELSGENSLLFHDYLVPVGSPENVGRIARLRRANLLEGFPLLHLDAYRGDPSAITWPDWFAKHGHRKTAPHRGNRFQRIAFGVEAVRSDAGFMICGLALVIDLIRSGEIVLPFPVSAGAWTKHAFAASFRKDALLRPQVVRFRAWLEEESQATSASLRTFVGAAPRARRKTRQADA